MLGVLISLLSICFGLGAKKSIKEKLADFNGHAVIKSYDTNNSYTSSQLKTSSIQLKKIQENQYVDHIQSFATKSGIIRNKIGFEGLILKGYDNHFDKIRFEKFLVAGKIPTYKKEEFSNEVMLSEKVANRLQIPVGSSFVMYFISDSSRPIYRKFQLVGTFSTDIKNIDDNFIIGDLNHVRRLNKWKNNEIGGYEVFFKDIEDLDEATPELANFIGYENLIEKSTDVYAQIISWIQLFDLNIIVILTIMLIVVLINLIMVLLILIIERLPFIGTMKTLGASNFQLQQVFVYYTLWITIPGLVAGNLLALLVLYLQKYFKIIKLNPENYYFEAVPVYLNFWIFFLLSFGLLSISLIVLLIPSFIISRISPTKVLKFD